jgi:large subunit ribosomal protein L17
MRHRVNTVKLNRTSSHRKAMFRNMVTSLFKHDKIRTTDTKAKELRRWADHLITLAKRGDLHARRQALSIIREKAVVHKLFAEAGERFGSVSGGYTRIIKIGRRAGDAASVSFIELVSKEDEKPVKKKSKKEASGKKKEAPKETPVTTTDESSLKETAKKEAVTASETSEETTETTEETAATAVEGDTEVTEDVTAAPDDTVDQAGSSDAIDGAAEKAPVDTDTNKKEE